MKKNGKIVAACLATLILSGCVNNQKEKIGYSSDSDSVTTENIADAVKSVNIDEETLVKAGFKSENGLPTIVDFSAVWCPPCQEFKPIFHDAAKLYAGRIDFIAVDVDSFPKLSEKYGVSAIPTVIYFDSEGKEINRTQGFLGKEDFSVAVEQLLNTK